MSELPLPPKRGQDILGWTERFYRAVKSIQPRSSTTIKVIRTEGGVTFETFNRDLFPVDRFKIVQSDSDAIEIFEGSWVRNGNRVDLTLDGGETFKTISGLSGASETYYIIVTLTNDAGTKADELEPDLLTASATTSLPSETRRNKIRVIGVVTTDSGSEINGIFPRQRNDIDDTVTIPDGNTSLDAADPVIRTTGWNPTNNVHEHESGLWNSWSEVDGTGIPVSEYRRPFLDKNASGTGNLEWEVCDSDAEGRTSGAQLSIQLKHDGTRDVTQLWNFDDASTGGTLDPDSDLILIRLASGGGGGAELVYLNGDDFANTYGDAIGGYLNDNSVISHHQLDGLNDGSDDADHSWAFSTGAFGNDDTFNRNFAQSLGDSGANISIHLDNRQLHESGGAWSLDYEAREFDGADWSALNGTIFKVLDTTLASIGDGALEVTGGVYAGGGMYIDAGGAGTAVLATDGTRTAELATGNAAIEATEGITSLFAADGTYAANAIVGGINVTSDTFYAAGVGGVNIVDGASDVWDMGLLTNVAGWSVIRFQAIVPGVGQKFIRALGVIE